MSARPIPPPLSPTRGGPSAEEVRATLRGSPLFDPDWYRTRYHAVRLHGMEPLDHFVAVGAAAGLRPCPLFDTAWYVASNPRLRAERLNPLWHFLHRGWKDGRKPHRLFDTGWYLATYRAAREAGLDPLTHFILGGWQAGCRPHILFDTAFYVERYPEAVASAGTPLAHYLDCGADGGAWPNPFFDTPWYLGRYAEARSSTLDPLSHYIEQGAARDFQPGRLFDTAWYRATYLAGAACDRDPLSHFIAEGAVLGTSPNRLFDLARLAEQDGVASRAEHVGRYARDSRNLCAPAARARPPRDRKRSRLLFIDAFYPRPNSDSGSLDTFNHLRCLVSLGFAVTFVASVEFSADHRHRRALEDLGVDCVDHYKYDSVESFLTRHGAGFDAFVLTRVHAGGHYYELARSVAPAATFIFNTVDLHHVREAREACVAGAAAAGSDWTRARELSLARQCEATIVVSSSEARLLRREVPGAAVILMPLLREIPGRSDGLRQGDTVGFIGHFGHQPNVDALRFFLGAIWPALRAEAGRLRLEIVGADAPGDLRGLAGEGVCVLGQVNELAPVLARWSVNVAPLRYGAGAKGKIVSGLAHGVPCVATPVAVEGMDLDEDRGVVVAAEASAFATAVLALLKDEARWMVASDAGLAAVRRINDVRRAPALWHDLFERTGFDGAGGR